MTTTCSKTGPLKALKLIKLNINLILEFNKFEFIYATYKRGLTFVEEQLVFYKKNEVMFSDQIVVIKKDASFKDSEIIALKSKIEKLKNEKECNQIKIDKFENASKCLDKLIGSQISHNSRKGMGFNVISPPPTGLFAPPTIDLSNSGLEEFQQPEFKGYGPKASKSVCVDTSNEVKKTLDTSLVEELVSEKEKQTEHGSKSSFKGADEGTGSIPGVLDVPTYGSDDEQIFCKSSDEEDDDEVALNDDDDDNDDDVNNDDDEDNDDNNDIAYNQDADGQEYDEHNDEEQGGDDEQTDSDNDGDDFVILINPRRVNQQSSSCHHGFVSNMLNPSPDIGIDSLFNLNTESTLLVDLPVTTFAKPPLLIATTLPPPPIPFITHLQQTPVPTPKNVLSSSLQDLPNFGSLFGFDHRLKTLENNFSEFNQTNQFAAAVSSILGIVDAYHSNKMHEAVKTVVHLQSKRLRDETQAENADFLNKLDDNIKKIIKDQVKEQLKKILIDKMESNKSIHISDEQRNLYKELVDAYENDKLILSFKRHRDDEDKDEEPSAGSNQRSKRRRARKEPKSTNVPKEKTSKTTGKSTEGSKSHHKSVGESAQVEEPMHTAKYLEEPAHQEFKTGVTEDQPNEETFQYPD
ncbi:hypothetical protein Tco_0962473 [Tanacetum coccineum]